MRVIEQAVEDRIRAPGARQDLEHPADMVWRAVIEITADRRTFPLVHDAPIELTPTGLVSRVRQQPTHVRGRPNGMHGIGRREQTNLLGEQLFACFFITAMTSR